ncbi:hypothetical protein [Dinghuibacter silviterrae]|uniref:Uncharacterized protein n=1 Tax=Dinghuibacter silviterrae TaxID=1539049 RepID=A0A4R8DIZ3_9BACT|nr:hypothetical protein [Dinghuibacter silviterrae]TDW97488.1 hypothetical protein EDB95_5338 [Dinghuibacter silviterrae]
MSIDIANYQFHSWSRKGISSRIAETDDLGTGTATQIERAQVPVGIVLNGAAQSKNFLLIGPGDILGVNSNMIVRTDPLNNITNYEPNYLAFIEFYDEDFAWRYTPAAPNGSKLRPWLFLLVLKNGEYKVEKNQVPLPAITVTSQTVFPPADESWLWAHMHSNANIPQADLTDYEKWLLSLNQALTADPDQVYCRLMSPRKLEANTAYTAFLVPAFETGRLAGLLQDTSTTPAQKPSWSNNGANGVLPVYYQWQFTTGQDEDFESLVNLLQPKPMDPSVGIRDMDCSQPGFVTADPPHNGLPGTQPPILGLEGALKSPTAVSTVFPNPPASNDFQVQLQKIANLPVTIIGTTTSGDPVISVPIYGSNHAMQSATDVVTLDITQSNWVNDLNRDPRTRVPAGFGTTIVQNNQAYFMKKAWQQVANIVKANKLINATVFMMQVAVQFTVQTLQKLPQQTLLGIASPVLSRVLGSPATILQLIRGSSTPVPVFSGAFRRLVRPRGRFVRKLTTGAGLNYAGLVNGLNAGTLRPGAVSVLPTGLPNTQTIAGQLGGPPEPAWLQWLTAHRLIWLIVLLVLCLILALLTGLWWLFGLIALAGIALYIYLGQRQSAITAATNLDNPQAELNSLPSIPPQPNFTLKLSNETAPPPPTLTTPTTDSVEAANFRTALTDVDTRMAIAVPVLSTVPVDFAGAYTKVTTAINPFTAYPLRLIGLIKFPGYISLLEPYKIFPAMAYPDFEDPMYKYLNAISQELLLPNIKLVPPNTISLLQTNPKFIESYMVGLNHEMGRTLLWNEYPTDERGSYFRQFWDVKGLVEPSTTQTEAQLTEAYKDITPIDTWNIASLLGTHNNRNPGSNSPLAVLLIRGELLKRYPNTIIFAQKAIAGPKGQPPVINLSLSDADFAKQVKFPQYKADCSPDIKFFGFDLTIDQARGTAPSPDFPGDTLGWFFVIQEVPGEPRFGMDVTHVTDSAGLSWADLSWEDFASPDAMTFITAGVKPILNYPNANYWGADSADMAFILFRKPSMVAVHATEMLQSLPSI